MPLASVSIGGAHNGYFKKPELVGNGYKLINFSELYQSFGIDTDHAKVERVRASIVDYSRYGVHDGDIFFTRSSLVLSGIAACNVLRKVKEPTLFECHVMRIVPDRKQVDSDFVAYCCRDSFSRSYLMSRAKQTTMTTISQPEIEQLPIPVPPLPQQRKIARILTTLDNVITQTEALIAKYQAIKQGLMHDLFTRGVDATGKLRPPQSEAPELYKQSELGWIPKEWEVLTLEEISGSLITYGIVQPGPHKVDGVPFIQTKDLTGGILDPKSMDRTSQLIADSYKRSAVRTDDLVCGIRATVGVVLQVRPELDGSNISRGVARISPRQSYSRRFTVWSIRSQAVQERMKKQIKGTTYAELTLPALRGLRLAIPPRAEQDRIAEEIDSCDGRIQLERTSKNKLHDLKTGLMQDLLTGKVPVKADEPEEITP